MAPMSVARTIVVVQARLGSLRLPRKVLRHLGGRPAIDVLLERLERAELVDEIVVATGPRLLNDDLIRHLGDRQVRVYCGDEHDVLSRFVQVAEQEDAEIIVRITGDCPLIDPVLLDQVVSARATASADYGSNIEPPSYPDGLDVEVFTREALLFAAAEALSGFDREHVTPVLRRSDRISRIVVRNAEDLSALRWTLDTPEDLEVIDAVVRHFAPTTEFSWQDVLRLSRRSPELFVANAATPRDEGTRLSSGQKLWRRAQSVIAGGNMLLSKNPDMYLPGAWPSYFSRAKGCTVWDLDGVAYTDMSLMGVGTNLLGYGHPEVDDAVARVIGDGNMSSLNCPEEVLLAERLLEINPWADRVRFARTGGEANAVAIRLARGAVGRETVAFCGYHGWHDWYLAANLGNEERLAGHLLPGLEPVGVPPSLTGTAIPFGFNDLDQLRRIADTSDLGVIKMEVARSREPDPGFLEGVRRLATERGAVLIFDECTSGFRETFGGLHQKYGVTPDVAMYGKALGNGYSITAVVGRDNVMSVAERSFISSTFWTERIGPAAALASLTVMEQSRSWEMVTSLGSYLREGWTQLASDTGLVITHSNIPALAAFAVDGLDAAEVKTFLAQEMLRHGYLAGPAVYMSTSHSRVIIDEYLLALRPVFATLAECQSGRTLRTLLNGPVARVGFTRLI